MKAKKATARNPKTNRNFIGALDAADLIPIGFDKGLSPDSILCSGKAASASTMLRIVAISTSCLMAIANSEPAGEKPSEVER